MKYAYYPGCSQEGSALDYGKSTGALCAALGIELTEIAGWSCCGSTPAHAVDTELSAALCARNLDLAARDGAEQVVTPCPSCLSNLRLAAERMKEPVFRARVDELLDAPAAGQLPESTSVMQLIGRLYDADSLAARVTRPLTGLKIAAYYGCLMSRPADVMQFGDPENPTLMESLLAACGAEMLEFPLKTVCCGASFGIPERPLTARNSGRILDLATKLGADVIAVACPLCQMNLDLRQKQAARAEDAFFHMPVLYFTQLMGLAMGIAPEHLGLDQLCVSAEPLLRKMEAARAAAGAKGTEAKGGKA
ncbi:CoB--CoM heterodisulfide reductase iron-sulfur subunit B family protein [uncultured Desulfovibrio sp.]|uniref:CoB--CoM heterodisulfide reductase iron-sulfur subunit B family protein n=1 Tax=uncultured Desulfovibrio sp. TaxID=167968 RepID=UPI0028049BD4|nr:CoB--CoM heterodisulfide reductase iron-sulfur subunit B family protein [uncultured Desulfovibrio sp.]